MRTIVLLAALAVASTAWAQEQKKEEANKEEAKPAAAAESKPKPEATAKRRFTPRRFQDARHCLEKGSNTEIIKCAEAYL